jgi:hypothetical protein
MCAHNAARHYEVTNMYWSNLLNWPKLDEYDLLACLVAGVEHGVVDELCDAVGAAAAGVLAVKVAPALTLPALTGLALF